jgi:formylglycine-generating enzyme required for sulfatase activity
MKHCLALVSGVAWCAALLAPAATAEHRFALLIGNSGYPNAPLTTPSADIQAVGAALQKRGFSVTLAENLTAEATKAAFKQLALAAPARSTVLVYFSGYVLPATPENAPNADNSLAPVDVKPANPSSVSAAQTGITQLFNTLARDGRSIRHILLADGCYPHPGQAPNVRKGLLKTGVPPAEALLLFNAPVGGVVTPPTSGLAPLAQKLKDALASSKSLAAVLSELGSHQETTLEDLRELEGPASPVVSPAATLLPGNAAGDSWVNPYGIAFRWCPRGSCTIGSPVASAMHEEDEVERKVSFTEGFWMAQFELLKRDYAAAVGTGVYLSTGTHKLHPLNKFWTKAETVLISKLNQSVPQGWEYAIPSEEEWEYAARAGTDTEYSFGNDPADLPKFGNFADRSLRESDSVGELTLNWKTGAKVHFRETQTGLFSYAHKTWDDHFVTMAPVGSFPPNAWGFYDMHGNLSEMTTTVYTPDRSPAPPEAHKNTPLKPAKVIKGGSWLSLPKYCRSAFRAWDDETLARGERGENALGLRLILRRKQTP